MVLEPSDSTHNFCFLFIYLSRFFFIFLFFIFIIIIFLIKKLAEISSNLCHLLLWPVIWPYKGANEKIKEKKSTSAMYVRWKADLRL